MELVRMYRDHGRTGRYNIVEIGYNARVDNLQSNVVLAKLPKLQSWLDRKQKIAEYYNQELNGLVTIPRLQPGNTHSYYVYVIQTPVRDQLREHLERQGVQTNIHYATTTHLQPAYANWYVPCPVAERTVKEILSLPCWYSMSDSQVEHVAHSVRTWFV